MPDNSDLLKDPLNYFPPEIVLDILHLLPISDVASLTRVSRKWHAFIDERHQDRIYSEPTKTDRDPSMIDPSLYHRGLSFVKYYEHAKSWKELCKKQILLKRNWASATPVTGETIIDLPGTATWCFYPDLKRRFMVTISHSGDVISVICMDTGRQLWSLKRNVYRQIECESWMWAPLVYDEVGGRGMAVWCDRRGNLEVWCTTEESGGERGMFEQTAVFAHHCTNDQKACRFNIGYNTLCLRLYTGEAFVYDMLQSPPQLVNKHKTRHNIVELSHQDQDHILYGIGHTYDVHLKATGKYLGSLKPYRDLIEGTRTIFYHINTPDDDYEKALELDTHRWHLPVDEAFPPRAGSKGRLLPVTIQPKQCEYSDYQFMDEDNGAAPAMLSGNIMVALADNGCAIIMNNWRDCLTPMVEDPDGYNGIHPEYDNEAVEANTTVVRCASRDEIFTGKSSGLSVHDNRILFHVRDRLYVLSLNADGTISPEGHRGMERPSYCFRPAGFRAGDRHVTSMVLFEDCLMYMYARKTVRVLSLAANIWPENDDANKEEEAFHQGLWDKKPAPNVQDVGPRLLGWKNLPMARPPFPLGAPVFP